ncbi:MAG: hypothetical protein ACRC3Y_00820 [Romboutsia sp.]
MYNNIKNICLIILEYNENKYELVLEADADFYIANIGDATREI